MPASSASCVRAQLWLDGRADDVSRSIPEEVPLAVTCNGTTFAVMMGTPADLEDFALGFAFTERIIDHPSDVLELEIIADSDAGIDLRLWLEPKRAVAAAARRRMMAGPVGCGLCGTESLAAANPVMQPVISRVGIRPADVTRAVTALAGGQSLHARTRAVHGAALLDCRSGKLLAVREDVGRHNALDKLAGHALCAGLPLGQCALVLTSRVSVELVHKAARLGTAILIAFSAPTARALAAAQDARITLIARARSDGFEVFTHGHRLTTGSAAHCVIEEHYGR